MWSMKSGFLGAYNENVKTYVEIDLQSKYFVI